MSNRLASGGIGYYLVFMPARKTDSVRMALGLILKNRAHLVSAETMGGLRFAGLVNNIAHCGLVVTALGLAVLEGK